MSSALAIFPWKSLPQMRAEDLVVESNARRALAELVDVTRFRDALSTLFVANLDDLGVRSTKVTGERRDLGACFTLRSGGVSVWLSLEPELIVLLLRRVLGQRDGLDAGGPLTPAMTGAALAVVTELCRRVALGPALRPDLELRQGPAGKHELVDSPGGKTAWALDFYLRIDGRTFIGFAAISGAHEPAARSLPRSPSGASSTPVTLQLVVARIELLRSDFESLMWGDVVLPHHGELDVWARALDSSNVPDGATAILCSPGAAQGLKLELRASKLCLAGTTRLCYDAAVTNDPTVKENSAGVASGAATFDAGASDRASSSAGASGMGDSSVGPTALDVVMEAPVVVHIELGSVTLPAHHWLSLRPGDVVTSQLPIGRPVTLRVAEQAVAEGELVSVDGQVGVRVLRFYST